MWKGTVATKAGICCSSTMIASEEAPVVLVVDDEALLRWHATDVLSAHGYRVLEAEDAATALRILDERPDVKLLFTDIQMPGREDGLALAEKVHQRWPGILLLVTSGNLKVADEDIPDDGRFLSKPYAEEDVIGQVADMIARGHQSAAGT